MASRRLTRHVIPNCQDMMMADGRIRAVVVGMALIEATRDAHGHYVMIELLDSQHGEDGVAEHGWRPHLIRGRAEVQAFQRG